MKTLKLICCIAILSTACENKTKRYYYDSGEIKEERLLSQKSDTSTYILASYYKNGQLKAKGQVVRGVKNGLWQEWYSDGYFKWQGNYKNGDRITLITNPKISINFNDDNLTQGKTTKLKLIAQGVHPKDLMIGCSNGIVKESNDEAFDYEITPDTKGLMIIYAAVLSDATGLVPIDTLIIR